MYSIFQTKNFNKNNNFIDKHNLAFVSMKKFLSQYVANPELISMPIFFKLEQFNELRRHCNILLNAQHKIVNFLLQNLSQKELLQFFDLPPSISPLIDWKELANADHMIARFDIIPQNKGFQLCEINAESSLGGLSIGDTFQTYLSEFNLTNYTDYSPRQLIANYLKKVCEDYHIENVIIFTLKQYLDEGSGTDLALYDTVLQTLDNKNVILAHEDNFPMWLLSSKEGAKTLVYRFPIYEDISCYELFLQIVASGAKLINSFVSEIRSNKKWLAIFHDVSFHNLLDEKELYVIKMFIPFTTYITSSNKDYFFNNKNHFVFKKNRSYGGQEVLIGNENSIVVLEKRIADLSQWTVQKLVECTDTPLPLGGDTNLTSCKIVMGLYLINMQSTGLLIRASQNSTVNVTSAKAYSGWAMPLDSEQEKLLSNVQEKINSENTF